MKDEDFKLVGEWSPQETAVTGLLMRDVKGRVLMQLRDKKEGLVASGQWSTFGGHVDPGEDILTCAIREAEEETGLIVAPDDLMPFIRFVRPVYGNARHYVCIKRTPIDPSDITLGEGAGFGFLTHDQVNLSNMGETAKIILTHYFDLN